jgi:hypothetical protein
VNTSLPEAGLFVGIGSMMIGLVAVISSDNRSEKGIKFVRWFLTAALIALAAVVPVIVGEQTRDLVISVAVVAAGALIGWQADKLIGDKMTPQQLRVLSYVLEFGGILLVAVCAAILGASPFDPVTSPFPF